MTVLALVVGAAILLTWVLVHSYSTREGSPMRRRGQPARTGHGGDGGWMLYGGGADAGDCSAGDGGGGCDGGGGGD